jgi:hypothetical protein
MATTRKKTARKKTTRKKTAPTKSARKKAPWEKPAPAKAKHTRLTPAKKATAKRSAKRAGRKYPNLVDNMRAAAGARDTAARRAAADALIRLYWRPAYGRLRLKWGLQPADAEDRVQEFFAGLLDGEVFTAYEPTRSRFRTYLRACLDRFAAKARRDEHRLKRGGGATHLPLDFAGAERELGLARWGR